MSKLMFARSRRLVSWSMREFGLSRPTIITPEFFWNQTSAGRQIGLAVGLLGGTLSYLEHKQALPHLAIEALSVFGKHSASKTLEAFMGELLSPTLWMAALLVLTFLVGVSRLKNGGLDRVAADSLTKTITGCYVVLQSGLMFVATTSASFGALALITGSWWVSLGFFLTVVLVAMHSAVVWSVLRMMFVLSDDDSGSVKSRVLGLLLTGTVIAMPKLLPFAEQVEVIVRSWAR